MKSLRVHNGASLHCAHRSIRHTRVARAILRRGPAVRPALARCQAVETQQDLNTEQSNRLKADSRVSKTAHPKAAKPKGAATPLLQTPKADTVVLYYSTGWAQAKLHCSLLAGDWHDRDLDQVNSSNGKWCVAQLPLNGANSAVAADKPLLEFVVHNGQGEWDKPETGGNYCIDEAGVFSLANGKLEKSTGEAVLLVSDLDDTMIGDDQATAHFRDYWEQQALSRGSLLVYNTGRAIDKFEELCREKQHCLAMPDVLMSSVGTKVYNWKSGAWTEDAEYAKRLDKAWKLEVVREATYAALAAAGKEKMHFRPPEEQNAHKVTCGLHKDVMDQVQQQIRGRLQEDGVEAHLILSGKGDWRFLDIVAINAGKLHALEFVRQKYGFAHNRTIACGDSGNDKDMLSGQNLAVVVGNAQPDLLEWVNDTQLNAHEKEPRLVVTNAFMANGILEGLQTFGLK